MRVLLVWRDVSRSRQQRREYLLKKYAFRMAAGEVRWWNEMYENRMYIKVCDDVDFTKTLQLTTEIMADLEIGVKDGIYPRIIFEEGDSLGSVGPLLDRLLAQKSYTERVIAGAIKALKGTRTLFASKQIGDIRRRLEVCLRW